MLQAQPLNLRSLLLYESGTFNKSAVDRHGYDASTGKIYATDSDAVALRIFDFKLNKYVLEKNISLSSLVNSVNDVAANNGLVAVVGDGSLSQLPGKVLLLDSLGQLLKVLTVGPHPVRVRFSDNGSRLFVSNQGLPEASYQSDPLGSISVINIGANPSQISQNDHQLIDFQSLDTIAAPAGLRNFGNNGRQTFAQDLEPIGMAVDDSSFKLWASLSANNALARIDYGSLTLDTVLPLDYKDWSDSVGLDASDVSQAINIRPYPALKGMYQPTGLEVFEDNGQVYLLCANEGIMRQNAAFDEVVQVRDLFLEPSQFPNLAQLVSDSLMGRLRVTRTLGDPDSNTIYSELYAFGGRSLSVRDANGSILWDSGDEIARVLAAQQSQNFNSNQTSNNSRKSRSPFMGAQPNDLSVARLSGIPYAAVTLRQMGGFMLFDLSNPRQPVFSSYELQRDFSHSANDPRAGNLGPREITLVEGANSPNGLPLVIVSYASSGTLAVFTEVPLTISETGTPRSLELYPNPTKGLLYYEGQEPASFTVVNSKGLIVAQSKSGQPLDLSHLPKGYYLIHNEEGHTVKIIKR